MSTLAEVRLWGRTIGAVSLADGSRTAAFQYDPAFAKSGIQVAPLAMPLSERVYAFPDLPQGTFCGLPGLLADALPDEFGNGLIDAWLATQGRMPESFNAVERLCFAGDRGMGALEFAPAIGPKVRRAVAVDIATLVRLASEMAGQRGAWKSSLGDGERAETLKEILRVGAVAGGARAKAVIAWNRATNEVRAGRTEAGDGFEDWLIKLDGVAGESGAGVVEFAYAQMAAAAGVTMSECRIFEENGRRHFMSRRFDRSADGKKLHRQSLGALAHIDGKRAGAYAYEQALGVVRQLGLGEEAVEQAFRRMAFNIVACNRGDHVNHLAFLMDKAGRWSLAPAFAVNYCRTAVGDAARGHAMTMNGKRDGFSLEDFRACGRVAQLRSGRVEEILVEVGAAVRRWPEFAAQAGVAEERSERIGNGFRLDLAGTEMGTMSATGGERAKGGALSESATATAEKRAADFVVVAHELN